MGVGVVGLQVGGGGCLDFSGYGSSGLPCVERWMMNARGWWSKHAELG